MYMYMYHGSRKLEDGSWDSSWGNIIYLAYSTDGVLMKGLNVYGVVDLILALYVFGICRGFVWVGCGDWWLMMDDGWIGG